MIFFVIKVYASGIQFFFINFRQFRKFTFPSVAEQSFAKMKYQLALTANLIMYPILLTTAAS